MAGLAWARLFPQVIRHCAQIKWKIIDIKHWFVLFSVRLGLAHGRGGGTTRTEQSIECNMHIVAWILVSNYDATRKKYGTSGREQQKSRTHTQSRHSTEHKKGGSDKLHRKIIFIDCMAPIRWMAIMGKRKCFRISRRSHCANRKSNSISEFERDREWSVRMPYSHAHERIDTNEKALHMFQLR